MSQSNPYQSPTPTANPFAQQPVYTDGIWRQGKLLILDPNAVLPNICIKSGAAPARKLTRKYYWHHPAIALIIILNLIIYIVVSMIVRKRRDLVLPLSQPAFSKRRKNLALLWLVGLGSVGAIIGIIGYLLSVPGSAMEDRVLIPAVLGIIAATVLMIGSLVWGQRVAGVLIPKRITNELSVFKGASPEFLDNFDEYPYPL